MTFRDVFRKSFLDGFSAVEMSTTTILTALVITCVLALYIFACYRFLTRRTFYSKNFNISLAVMAVLTAGIILTIQSSVIVSLGMVGALSIVRFRTAVKDPMDLIFLFWSIAVGIMCGAGLAEIAVISSILVTLLLILLDRLPVARAPMMLVVNAADRPGLDSEIEKAVQDAAHSCRVKTRSLTNGQLSMVMELRIGAAEGSELTRSLSAMEGVSYVSILAHDGEVTF